MRFRYLCACLCMLPWVCPTASNAQELLLSDFNNRGFQYTWDFSQTLSPTSVRLTDLTQGWGGGGWNTSLDLTPYADGRVVVDFEKHSQNGASTFAIELYDGNGNSGAWPFSLGQVSAGQVVQQTHPNTLSNPSFGVGDFQNLDLSNITKWQVLGEWASTSPFDVSFDNLALSTTAVPTAPTYEGRAADAGWRSDAATRIDDLRKADMQINVVDRNGVAIPKATVSVEMQQHEFGFGTAVQAWRFGSNTAENITYRNRVNELFNQATIENNLKWPPWDGDWGNTFSQRNATNALNWLDANGIESRGHAMVWPGYDNLPNSLTSLVDTSPMTDAVRQTIRDRIADHIAEIGAAANGLVRDWDVVNEPRTNHTLMDLLPEGNQAMVDWFQLARAADPDAKLFLNEYGILTSSGLTDTGNQQLLLSQLNDLIEAGAPIDGVGLQSHFSDWTLSGPEQLWAILDQFGETGLDVQITEYDFQTNDSQLEADYMRDFLTAVFAHESVTDFSLWGFFENAHWRPEAALFDADWNIQPNGQAFIDLVLDEWWTNEEIVSNSVGEGVVRGFKGDYEIAATFNGVTGTQVSELTGDNASVTVTVDVLLGDFNGDGRYECGDVGTLGAVVRSELHVPSFDITGDGLVDQADLDAWLAHAGGDLVASGGSILPGDANLDGIVDIADFDAWNENRFQSTGWCGGDFNSDGIADVSDFNIWMTRRGQVSGAAAGAVPEPRGLLGWALGVGAILFCRRSGGRKVTRTSD